METHTSYYYGNSSTRNGTCLDSPPPPYTGGGDLSFEGVKFFVVGSGRKALPCQHCRRDLGTFETLLLHSEGLKKGSVRNEVIFMVNVLERYNATGNYELADVRPPLYQIPSSSHFGAEYCRHCNQADSLANKPLSCASTRAETSSHDSFSDAEQFSTSLDDNSPPTNKYVSKYDQSQQGFQEDKLAGGRQHQNGQTHSTEQERHRQHINTSQRHQDYITNSTSHRRSQHRKRSSSPKTKISQHHSSIQSRTDYIPSDSPEYTSASYADEITNESKPSLPDIKLKSMTNLPYQTDSKYPVVAPQQNEVFFAEDVKKLKDKMGSKIRDVLKKKTDNKSPYIKNRWGQDLEKLKNDLLTDPKTKNIIDRLVENSIKSWISSNKEVLKSCDSLKDSGNRVLSRKGDIPPPLKIDTNEEDELNVVCSKETLAEKLPDYPQKGGQNDDKFISDKEEFQESTYIPHDDKSYSPTPQNFEMQNQNKTNYDMIQTPANDSGFFSPSPRIISNLSPFENERNEGSAFRNSLDDISCDIGSPDTKFTGKWKKDQHTHYDSADSNRGYGSDDYRNNQIYNDDHNNNNNNNVEEVDDYDDDDDDDDDNKANVTNSCKIDAADYDFQTTMTCETSSETAILRSTSSTCINDEENDEYDDYDITNSVMSPRDDFAPSIPPTPWDDFRRSISPDSLDCPNDTGNDSPSPEQTCSTPEQKYRRSSAEDTQPTTTSLKKNFTLYEKIENTPLIYQDIPNNFSPPRQSCVTPQHPNSPESDRQTSDKVNNNNNNKKRRNSSSKDSTKRAEKREGEDLDNTTGITVAKRLNFENDSSVPLTETINKCLTPAIENEQKTLSPSDSESNISVISNSKTDGSDPSESNNEDRQYTQTPPLSLEEKPTVVNLNTKLQKNEPHVENSHQKQPERVKINEKSSADCSPRLSKERFTLKEPDPEAIITCKARAILQSLETSNKTIGTYTPIELENVRTRSSTQNLLFTGGPFQADQNFRSWLADIVCNKDGQYIVSDWSNCCVQMFSTSGLPGDRVTFTSGPWGLALMNESIVACTVPHAKQISLLSHGSRLIVVGLVSTIRRYWGIAVTKGQNLVCSCTQGIDLLSADGKVLRTIQYNEVGLEFFVFPQYLTVGDNGVIYVSDSCGTYLIGLPEDGNFSFSFKPLKGIRLKTPRAIEYGQDGFVYLADTDTDKIYRLTEDGTFDSELYTAADDVHGPLAITIRDNKMVVTQKDSSILILPI